METAQDLKAKINELIDKCNDIFALTIIYRFVKRYLAGKEEG